jgi:hypothetical protein
MIERVAFEGSDPDRQTEPVRGLGRTGEQGAVTQVDSVKFPEGQNVVPDCLGNPVTSSQDREVQRFRSHSQPALVDDGD